MSEEKDMQQEFYDSMVKGLVEKDFLLLSVDIKTPEGAEFLMRWMYDEKSDLIPGVSLKSINWDASVVSKTAIDQIIMSLERLKDGIEVQNGN